jgi:hypothetical protein
MTDTKRGWVKTENGWEPQGDREKQIVFQIQAGRPTKDIAGQFLVSPAYISRVRRRIGAPDLRHTRKRLSASAARA